MRKNDIRRLLGPGRQIIFEVGSADGSDTVEFVNEFGEDLEIHCFEPEPKNISIGVKRIPVRTGKLFRGVLSDIDGFVEFNRSRTDNEADLCLSGSILPPKEHLNRWPSIIFDNKIKVKSTTMDHYCHLNGVSHIDFIWADVQGAELQMVRGGVQILRENVRYLYTEYSNEELYKGQSTLAQILHFLGEHWIVSHDFKTDVLLRNTRFRG